MLLEITRPFAGKVAIVTHVAGTPKPRLRKRPLPLSKVSFSSLVME